jgi:hypothetical protein
MTHFNNMANTRKASSFTLLILTQCSTKPQSAHALSSTMEGERVKTPGMGKQQLIATHMQQRLCPEAGNYVHYRLLCRQQNQQSSSSIPLDFPQAFMLTQTFTAFSEI